MDRTLEDTFFIAFTTRAFATGIPTGIAGGAVISVYENNSTTQITAGVSLQANLDSVTGFNVVTIIATAANGFEAGKDYNLVITTGTVDGVSVVGEVIGTFSLSLSAAAKDLANATDGLGAIKADTAAILVDTDATLPAQISAIFTQQMTEAYAMDGVAPTPAQALFMIQQILGDFTIIGTTISVKQIDGSTEAATYTLDDATNPTSLTRAT